MIPEIRLQELGLELPDPPRPIANFRTFAEGGRLVFLSGQGPMERNGFMHTGKVGQNVTTEEAYTHARLSALNLLAVIRAVAGNLTRVSRIVKVLGFVNAVPDFADHPQVINGCSDLFVNLFGEQGGHARSSIGVGSLPGNITVEIEAVIELAS